MLRNTVLIFLFALLNSAFSHPDDVEVSTGLSSSAKKYCCVDSKGKPEEPSHVANYDCSQLAPFGEERCNSVYGGNVCQWKKGKDCHPELKCQRVPYYEQHYKYTIDVGRCVGVCNDNHKCKPKAFGYVQIKDNKVVDYDGEADLQALLVKVVKSCECDDCGVVEANKVIEVPVGKCEGGCDSLQGSQVCSAGVQDNFDLSNGLEVSSPSPALLTNYLSLCSAGVQVGFDTFTDNRCFGHTFSDCFVKGPCPLRRAKLEICLKAANVPLTHTDSMMLGVNGNGLWGQSLVTLNGGSWNPGQTMCHTFDLDNLPGGVSILNMIDSVGHLDVAVQDDTAVDFVNLFLQYDDCERCLPTSVSYNSFFSSSGVKEWKEIKDCDCISMSECHREELNEVHFVGTLFEKIIDVGQCVGKCPRFSRCVPEEYDEELNILGPSGNKNIKRVKSCKCNKLTWNAGGLLVRG